MPITINLKLDLAYDMLINFHLLLCEVVRERYPSWRMEQHSHGLEIYNFKTKDEFENSINATLPDLGRRRSLLYNFSVFLKKSSN